MDTNKMRDLKALAEAATQSHGARRVEIDHNGVHVIGDGSWKILSAWNTPDGKGANNAQFAAATSPATVLALLAEIDRLIPFEEAYATACHVRNRLIRENEALRKDAERYRWLRQSGQCDWDASFEKLEIRIKTPHFDCGDINACIDEAMGKEASHG